MFWLWLQENHPIAYEVIQTMVLIFALSALIHEWMG